jgi:DNA polymerase-1
MMEAAGFPVDRKALQELHVLLLGKQEVIAKELIAEFGSWYEPVKKSLAQGRLRSDVDAQAA